MYGRGGGGQTTPSPRGGPPSGGANFSQRGGPGQGQAGGRPGAGGGGGAAGGRGTVGLTKDEMLAMDTTMRTEGTILARFNMTALLTKEWTPAFWTIDKGVFYLYRNKDDYTYNPKGVGVKKQFEIKANLRVTSTKFKEYPGVGNLHHFDLEQVTEAGPSVIVKFASPNKEHLDHLIRQLEVRVVQQRNKIFGSPYAGPLGENNDSDYPVGGSVLNTVVLESSQTAQVVAKGLMQTASTAFEAAASFFSDDAAGAPKPQPKGSVNGNGGRGGTGAAGGSGQYGTRPQEYGSSMGGGGAGRYGHGAPPQQPYQSQAAGRPAFERGPGGSSGNLPAPAFQRGGGGGSGFDDGFGASAPPTRPQGGGRYNPNPYGDFE